MFCSLILRIRQISICNNFESFHLNTLRSQEKKKHLIALYQQLTLNQLQLAILKTQMDYFYFVNVESFSSLFLLLCCWPSTTASLRDELVLGRSLGITVSCYVSVCCVSIHSISLATNMIQTICHFEFCHSFVIFILPINALQSTPIMPP